MEFQNQEFNIPEYLDESEVYTDTIGNITVPRIPVTGTFPIVPDWGHSLAMEPRVFVHRFESGNAKHEQRFYQGSGGKRFVIRKDKLTAADRTALIAFWESQYGPYGQFRFNAPSEDGMRTDAYIVRFADEPLSVEQLSDNISSCGVTLIEVPTSTPSYAVASTCTRFPSEALETALLSQVQEIIPLLKIQPRESGYPAIYLSDRRCYVGSQLYQPRLLNLPTITQGMNGESDNAEFVLGNADRVMRDLANDTELSRAAVEYSLYHVGSGIKIDLWKGELADWNLDAGAQFPITASEGIYELTLPYPCRRISRTCWKSFDDGNGCPFTDESTGLDTTHFPSVDDEWCDKGYDTTNGCLAHGMKFYFGGILAKPQTFKKKGKTLYDLAFNTGKFTALVSDSIFDSVLPEIYCNNPSYVDDDGTTKYGIPVDCRIATGRDESDAFRALGVVGEGPITFGSGHTLDGMDPGAGGLFELTGTDPAGERDYFSLRIPGDQTGGDWRKVLYDGNTYDDNFAAGTAAIQIRRNDDSGLQLINLSNHSMQAIVTYGLHGWVWTAANTRTWEVLSNPIWIVVNVLLKALGLRYASATVAEQYFDVTNAIAAAAVCDTSVTKVIGSGSETQFTFQAVLTEEKPLKDWMQEILNSCLGYYTWSFGKLDLGIRYNSSVVEAFTTGNILFGSLKLSPIKPGFNYITGSFKDAEYGFQDNTVNIYDEDHAQLVGGATAPLYSKASMSLTGVTGKSQTARIITTRLREELGGIEYDQWRKARSVELKTTVLSLTVKPGMISSLTHGDMPDGEGEFRITGWRLNPDWSIDIQGRTTVDDMYDMTVGNKPADVAADPVYVDTAIATSPFAPVIAGLDEDGTVLPDKVNGDSLSDDAIAEIKSQLDADYEPAGTAAAAVSSHVGASDPHTQYQKETDPVSPVTLANTAAGNNTIYYSSDNTKLVYKDGSGAVHDLY